MIQERQSRITKRLNELKNELADTEAPKDIIAIKKKVTTQENATKNVPSSKAREELAGACKGLKAEI